MCGAIGAMYGTVREADDLTDSSAPAEMRAGCPRPAGKDACAPRRGAAHSALIDFEIEETLNLAETR
jgi:hypothetical protein